MQFRKSDFDRSNPKILTFPADYISVLVISEQIVEVTTASNHSNKADRSEFCQIGLVPSSVSH
jgi:hypothetical protein